MSNKEIKRSQTTIVIIIAVLLSSCSDYLSERHQRKLKEHFIENFDTLVKIERMHSEDPFVSRLDPTYIVEDSFKSINGSKQIKSTSLSPERVKLYRDLFEKAGLERGIQRMTTSESEHSRRVEFIKSDYVGFTYREKSPVKVFNTFKECNTTKLFDNYRCYVFLRKNWYMHSGSINEFGQPYN